MSNHASLLLQQLFGQLQLKEPLHHFEFYFFCFSSLQAPQVQLYVSFPYHLMTASHARDLTSTRDLII